VNYGRTVYEGPVNEIRKSDDNSFEDAVLKLLKGDNDSPSNYRD